MRGGRRDDHRPQLRLDGGQHDQRLQRSRLGYRQRDLRKTADFDDVDPFYMVKQHNDSVKVDTCVGCLRFDRFSEGECVCASECPTHSHFFSDLVVGNYPAFIPTTSTPWSST